MGFSVALSLLKREEGPEGESRFAMLATLRDYALERLHAGGMLPTLRERHAHYYLSFAQEAAEYFEGDQQQLWLKRLDQAYENIRAAMA